MRKIAAVRAHGVLHTVLRGGRGELHGDARHGASVSDVLARLEVTAVFDGAGEVGKAYRNRDFNPPLL